MQPKRRIILTVLSLTVIRCCKFILYLICFQYIKANVSWARNRHPQSEMKEAALVMIRRWMKQLFVRPYFKLNDKTLQIRRRNGGYVPNV